jgi:1-acyl-sn-glycerol-3-phosphate acyltransferase
MLKALAKLILRIGGWTAIGDIPKLDKAVFIAAPHTSNWDGFWLIIFRFSHDVKLRFLAKHTLFWWPLSSILKGAGAIAIDRSFASSTVQELVDLFAKEDHFFLALAPEGTRKWKPYWKTGFYQIASAANVPIVLAFIDYDKKELGIGGQIDPSDGIDINIEEIRKFYAPFKPCRPERMSPIEFPPDRYAGDDLDSPKKADIEE